MNKIVIAGIDTEIGKTTFCAALMLGLDNAQAKPRYWKPVQSGITEGTDTKTAQNLSALPDECFIPEGYILTKPLSPHHAAELDNVEIDINKLDNMAARDYGGMLIIEGAGGLMVPLNRENLQIDLYKKWQIPVVLCARTGLGTINHTLMSVETLQKRNIPLKGIVFIGENNPDNVKTIAAFSKAHILGIFPQLQRVERNNLMQAFAKNFNIRDFV